jgi:hypothetical protein
MGFFKIFYKSYRKTVKKTYPSDDKGSRRFFIFHLTNDWSGFFSVPQKIPRPCIRPGAYTYSF